MFLELKARGVVLRKKMKPDQRPGMAGTRGVEFGWLMTANYSNNFEA